MLNDIKNHSFVVGTKQTLKAVEKKTATIVFLAEDASDYMKQKVAQACNNNQVRIESVPSMTQLGSSCGISKGAVTAAIISE